VTGDLLSFPAGELRSLLPSLDALEGYRPEASEQHYVRVRREVQARDGVPPFRWTGRLLAILGQAITP
jgi:hypothetical protein